MAIDIEQYKLFLSEIIAKQAIVLGPHITVMKARSVKGLKVEDDGTVSHISGDPKKVTNNLINTYVQLSDQIMKNTLSSILNKYPELQQEDK